MMGTGSEMYRFVRRTTRDAILGWVLRRDQTRPKTHAYDSSQQGMGREPAKDVFRDAPARSRGGMHTLLDHLSEVVLRLDDDDRIEAVNRTVTLYGHAPGALIGSPLLDLVHDGDRPAVRSALAAARRDDATRVVEARLFHADAAEFELMLLPGSDPDGALQVIARDITARQWADTVIERTEHRYRTIFERANDAIFLMNSEHFVLFNEPTLKVFRRTPEELLDRTPWDLSPDRQPGDRSSREAALQKIDAALAGEPQLFEWVHRRGDGSLFHAEVSLSAIEWGQDVNLLAVVRDVSDRKAMEEELRRSEERYRRIVQDQTEFIVRWLPDGRRTFVNDAYCEFFGVTREDSLASSIMLRIAEEDQELVAHKIRSLSPERPVATAMHRSIRSDGSVAWVLWTDRAFFDEEGRVVEYQSVGRDMTERHRLEDQVHRTQKLEALGRLAGGIAHDFNNSLAIILGYAELLEEGVDDDPLVEHVKRVTGAAERAAGVINQLLTFARRSSLQTRPVRLQEPVEAIVAILSATLPRNIVVETHLDPSLVVRGDRSQLENMLLNLGINAGHAMPDGGTLAFELRRVERAPSSAASDDGLPAGAYAELRVRDTGVGIDPADWEHIFEPFFTTRPLGEGTGLGLAVVYGTVKAHGGDIAVDSRPGEGTSFTILLPLTDTVEEPEELEAPVAGNGETILVVEDEAGLREYIERTLHRLDYHVRTAADGQQAIQAYQAAPDDIDLVLLDMNMPVMDGRATYHALRKLDPDVRIIATTGYAAAGTEGMEDVPVLPKPFSAIALSQAVRRELSRRG
jgi:two-component system cell cycle sensor histidine kinase/response regulator CckA